MAVSVSFALCLTALLASLLSAHPNEQQRPLLLQDDGGIPHPKTFDLLHELKLAEIIPTVIDVFEPIVTISVIWSNASNTDTISADYGNTLEIEDTQSTPLIEFINSPPSANDGGLDNEPQLTIVMTDPDAPSRTNPEWSEFCHWIATRVPLVDSTDGVFSYTLKDIMPYRPPGPPAKTGAHRYVLIALAPLNRTTEKLNLRPPTERRRWGHEGQREGVRRWAKEMGLGVVGANFFYERNAEQ